MFTRFVKRVIRLRLLVSGHCEDTGSDGGVGHCTDSPNKGGVGHCYG